jgi:uncharacterized protein with PIN domain
MSAPQFAADRSLGKLAKWLRLLGYDTLAQRGEEDGAFLCRAQEDDRWLVTRSRVLARARAPRTVFIENNAPRDQIAELFLKTGLSPDIRLVFSRCAPCNTPVEPLAREDAMGAVPDYVYSSQERFTKCPACGRVYWPGTHIGRALDFAASALRGGAKGGLRGCQNSITPDTRLCSKP